jgi:acetone carboxylase alpha subunit
MTGPNLYLGRAFTPDHQAFGRFRGGAAWESLWMVRGSRLVNVTLTGSGCHNGGVFHKGLFGGYPAPGWKCLWARGTNLRKRIDAGKKVPSSINEAEGMLKSGALEAEEWYVGPLNQWSPNLKDDDLFGVLYQGGSGYGDPLERDAARIEKDMANGLLSERVAKKMYGYAGNEAKTAALRDKLRKQRLEESIPAERWWKQERKRAKKGDVSTVVAQTFARSAKLSNKIKDMYLDFWELDAFPYADTGNVDFQTNAPTGFYYPKSAVKPPAEPKDKRKKASGRKRRAA